MRIMGIDPGLSGAVALLDVEAGTLEVWDIPTIQVERNGKAKREINVVELANIIDAARAGMVYIERVGAMPGQGTSSMFAFGRCVGQIEGIVGALGIPKFYVTPQKWQKACGMRAGKEGSRIRAAELFPRCANMFSRKKDDGRSDAALISWFGATN